MKCLNCGHSDSKVIDSRTANEGTSIRRRRECEKCEHRFTTHERIEEFFPMVVKKDGTRQTFDSVKILRGIQRACEKRPVSIDQMNDALSEIEKAVQNFGKKEIPAEEIGEIVMKSLKQLDDVAYVRFASVYRSFQDVNEFMSAIQNFLKKK